MWASAMHVELHSFFRLLLGLEDGGGRGTRHSCDARDGALIGHVQGTVSQQQSESTGDATASQDNFKNLRCYCTELTALSPVEPALSYLAERTIMVGIESSKYLLHFPESYAVTVHDCHLTLTQRHEREKPRQDDFPTLCLCACSEHTTLRHYVTAARKLQVNLPNLACAHSAAWTFPACC